MGEQGQMKEKHSRPPQREPKPANAIGQEAFDQPAIHPQVDQINYLQRTIGNRAVNSWLTSSTRRIDIGQPGVYYQRRSTSGSIQLWPEQVQRDDGDEAQGEAPQTDEEAREIFYRGRFAFNAGNYDEALRLWQLVIESPGIDPARRDQMLPNIAQAQARLGDFEGASATLERYRATGCTEPPVEQVEQGIEQLRSSGGGESGAEEAMPETDEEAREVFSRGRDAAAAGNYAEAARLFQAVLNAPGLDPSRRPMMIANLFNAQIRAGDFDEAETTLEQYRQTGSSQPPVEHLEQTLQRFRAEAGTPLPAEGGPQTDEQAQVVFYQARDAFNAGDYAEALRLFEAVISAPGLARSRVSAVGVNIVLCEAHLGNIDSARTAVMNYRQLYALYGGPIEPDALLENAMAIAGQ